MSVSLKKESYVKKSDSKKLTVIMSGACSGNVSVASDNFYSK